MGDRPVSADLARAIVESLDDRALDRLACLLSPRLAGITDGQTLASANGWLDARAAAEYLGLPSADQLHKLTAARTIPFSQERPGAKCYFRRGDLDAYRKRHLHGGGSM